MDKPIVKVIEAKKGLNVLTFLGLTLIPFILIINPRYFIRFAPNIYFLILTYRPVFCSLFKTFLT